MIGSRAAVGLSMASLGNASVCALVATAFCTVLGYAIAGRLLPRVLAVGAAPVVGWAAFSAVTLPVAALAGFSAAAVAIMAVCALAFAGGLLMLGEAEADAPAPAIPLWCFAAAAALALAPTIAITPKFSDGGVHLADAIFDHAKVAIIDALTRQGLPPVDPSFGAAGGAGLAYYYLWHFSAAELALPLRISGWEADIGLTFFTAFASLSLMMGMAVWFAKRSIAAILAIVFAAGGSLWQLFEWAGAKYGLTPLLQQPSGFAGWLFQSAWAPQHVMAASCVMAAFLFVGRELREQRPAGLVVLVLLVVAGFESSAYVGGITFGLAALAAGPLLLAEAPVNRRIRTALVLVATAIVAVIVVSPFIRTQLAFVAARGGGSPITLHPFEVMGDMFSPTLRHALDLPAYWLILLPIEFPAIYGAGLLTLVLLLRAPLIGLEKLMARLFAVLASAGLLIAWLLFGSLGDNNDLAMRAVLPAAMVLIVVTAAGVASLRPRLIAPIAFAGFVLGAPGSVELIRYNAVGSPAADAKVFALSPELWAAVRRYAPPSARVANNPLYLSDLTPWPGNMSWALLSNRNSCFAGREMALALAPLPPERREAINAQFIRVFAGKGSATDVGDMANTYGCDAVVLVPQDGAWSNDPFASAPDYLLAEAKADRWRIYVRRQAFPVRLRQR